MMQSERNYIPTVYIISNDNKVTHYKFLTHIFEFRQVLRTIGIPELGYRKFCVADPQHMKSSQLCMSRGGSARQITHFCHLCQTHSDDIAHPNQLDCVTSSCARTPDKLCISASLSANNDTLGTQPEEQRLTFVFEQI
jgi:hypothetical protein